MFSNDLHLIHVCVSVIAGAGAVGLCRLWQIRRQMEWWATHVRWKTIARYSLQKTAFQGDPCYNTPSVENLVSMCRWCKILHKECSDLLRSRDWGLLMYRHNQGSLRASHCKMDCLLKRSKSVHYKCTVCRAMYLSDCVSLSVCAPTSMDRLRLEISWHDAIAMMIRASGTSFFSGSRRFIWCCKCISLTLLCGLAGAEPRCSRWAQGMLLYGWEFCFKACSQLVWWLQFFEKMSQRSAALALWPAGQIFLPSLVMCWCLSHSLSGFWTPFSCEMPWSDRNGLLHVHVFFVIFFMLTIFCCYEPNTALPQIYVHP